MASETLAKIDRAYDVVSELCQGDREWIMSIPARPDHDPDLIISDALRAARGEIARLTRELEEARELIREMVGAEPVLQDPRIDYVEIQVSRAAWEEARTLVEAQGGK